MESVVIFEELVRQQKSTELVAFLVGLAKADVVPVRHKTRQLVQELERFWEYQPGKWGSLITPEQRQLLFLAGLRTYSRQEAFGAGFSAWGTWDARPNSRQAQAWLWQVLAAGRPTWLGDWLLRRAEANSWSVPNYALLRALEERGFIEFHPKLFALAAPGVLAQLGTELNQQTPQPTDLLAVAIEHLRADSTLLARDLPLAFEYDTTIDAARAHVQKPRPGNWAGAFDWHEWHRRHPAQVVGWVEVLPALAAAGHLDRAALLRCCRLALRREFRRPLLSWLKELYGRLAPTPAEGLAHQADLVELLIHAQPPVVNFALDQLKALWAQPGFEVAPLLEYAALLVLRPELKASLAGLLTGLTRLARTGAAPALPVARVLATALAHPHAAVQQRAARCLAELLKAKKSLFAPAELPEVRAALAQQHELLGAKAHALLAAWLEPLAAPAWPYAPKPAGAPELSAATALAPVADWPELLYLAGRVLRHDDPLALERWLDGLLRLQAQLPATFAEQLLPYLHRLLPGIEKDAPAQADEALASCTTQGHEGLVQALLLSWYTDFRVRRVPATQLLGPHLAPDPLVAVEKQRLGFAELLLHQGHALPLLSTPTHAPYWVAPPALVARLLAYEAAQVAPHPADLAVALARTAWQHPAAAAAALGQLPALQHAGLRELLAWLLAPEAASLPARLAPPAGRLRQFTVRLGLLLPVAPASQPATLAEALPWLWAVAARTRQPAAKLPALGTLAPAACPGLDQPWQPTWEVAAETSSYVQTWLPGQPTYTTTWRELRLGQPGPVVPAPTPLLLYSLHAAQPLHTTAPTWYQLAALAADYPFLASLLPQHPASLRWQALHLAARRAEESDGTALDILLHALRDLLLPGPTLEEAATLLLAVGLGHAAPAARALAQQVLRTATAQARLCPRHLGRTLGHLLAADFVPAPRLADSLLPLRTAPAPAADALRQLLEALLAALPPAAPRQLRRLLELYADLQAQLRSPVAAAVRERLTGWDAGVLKPISAALLAAA